MNNLTAREYFAIHAPAVPATFNTKYEEVLKISECITLTGPRFTENWISQAEAPEQRAARWAVQYADALLKELSK